MIVVDTNVIVGAYLHGPHAKEIEALIEQDREWFAPYLWRYEFRNVLAFYLRKELLDVSEALLIMQYAEARMRNQGRWTVSERVLDLAKASGRTSYDCEFVSLAKDLNVQLVTIDRKVLRQFPSIAISPREFISG